MPVFVMMPADVVAAVFSDVTNSIIHANSFECSYPVTSTSVANNLRSKVQVRIGHYSGTVTVTDHRASGTGRLAIQWRIHKFHVLASTY
jgi:hypothetical protein